jgi:putative acetyltransferase
MKHSVYNDGLNNEVIELFKQTFTDSESKNEGIIIGDLVKRFLENTPKKDIYVFLTMDNNKVVGGVIFTRLTFEKSKVNTWLLSPAAVATSMQGTGLGQALINYAHDFLKNEGIQQIVSYGDINFYSKVGYKVITEDIIPSPLKLTYPEGWIARTLGSKNLESIKGKSYCVEAINAPELW